LHDHVVDLGYQGGPVALAVGVASYAGQAGVLTQGGVEDRDRLRQGQGQVKEQRALAGLAGRPGAELPFPFWGGLWLGGQQGGVDAGGFLVAGWRAAQRGAVGGLALAEEQVVLLAVD
jgi:hypothetical protein